MLAPGISIAPLPPFLTVTVWAGMFWLLLTPLKTSSLGFGASTSGASAPAGLALRMM